MTEDSNNPPSSNFTPPKFDLIAIAASAGGLTALSVVLSVLPSNFPVGILIVQHLDPHRHSLLADILKRRTALGVKEAEEGDRIQVGQVFIAPPDHHLLVNPEGKLTLTQTELVHFVRPSADLLFESVAAHFRKRAIALVLSGTGSDGAMGVQAIKKMEGIVIAQDQITSDFFGMPGAAIQTGSVDFILPLEQIPMALIQLVTKGAIA